MLQVRQGLCEAAVKHEAENRYCNLFPYDSSRLVLTGLASGDCINANGGSLAWVPEHRFSRRRRLGRTRQVTRGGMGTGSNGGVRRSSTIEREGRCTLPHDLFVEQPARKRAVGIRLSRLQIIVNSAWTLWPRARVLKTDFAIPLRATPFLARGTAKR